MPDLRARGSGSGDDSSKHGRELDPERLITIVSGLPRSGTSMMMQMLGAAGLDLATDEVRVADANNPRGYFELEAVKGMREDVSFLKDCVGSVVKIVAPLLPFLSAEYDYRVIFMHRDLGDVLASQRRMLERRGGAASDAALAVDDAALERAYRSQIEKLQRWLDERPHIDSLDVQYESVVGDPARIAVVLAEFLQVRDWPAQGAHDIPDSLRSRLDAMVNVVDRSP